MPNSFCWSSGCWHSILKSPSILFFPTPKPCPLGSPCIRIMWILLHPCSFQIRLLARLTQARTPIPQNPLIVHQQCLTHYYFDTCHNGPLPHCLSYLLLVSSTNLCAPTPCTLLPWIKSTLSPLLDESG